MTETVRIPRYVGDLTVLKETGDGYTGYFDCLCVCGKQCRVWYSKLLDETVTSCGCTPTKEKPNKVY